MVRALYFHCRGRRFNPWSGTKILQVAWRSWKKKKEKNFFFHFSIMLGGAIFYRHKIYITKFMFLTIFKYTVECH